MIRARPDFGVNDYRVSERLSINLPSFCLGSGRGAGICFIEQGAAAVKTVQADPRPELRTHAVSSDAGARDCKIETR